MDYVQINGRTIETDRYGYLIDCEVTEDLYHSTIGVIKCRLRRCVVGNRLTIEADMWQSAEMTGLDNTYITFRAGVYMKPLPNSYGYEIADQKYKNANDTWKELEWKISNLIQINE